MFRRDLLRIQRVVDIEEIHLTIEQIMRARDRQRLTGDLRELGEQVEIRRGPNAQSLVTSQTDDVRRWTDEIHVENDR